MLSRQARVALLVGLAFSLFLAYEQYTDMWFYYTQIVPMLDRVHLGTPAIDWVQMYGKAFATVWLSCFFFWKLCEKQVVSGQQATPSP